VQLLAQALEDAARVRPPLLVLPDVRLLIQGATRVQGPLLALLLLLGVCRTG
jgi:hypothetical protein